MESRRPDSNSAGPARPIGRAERGFRAGLDPAFLKPPQLCPTTASVRATELGGYELDFPNANAARYLSSGCT